MSENDLIDLGFDRFDETAENSGTSTDWCYYTLDLGGLSLISNASDEWDRDGIYVEIMDTNIQFKGAGDLWDFVEILKRLV